MRTHVATRLLALSLPLRYVARIQTSLNSCDRSQRQNSVAVTMIFTCHTRRFVAATCRATCRSDLSNRVSRPLYSTILYGFKIAERKLRKKTIVIFSSRTWSWKSRELNLRKQEVVMKEESTCIWNQADDKRRTAKDGNVLRLKNFSLCCF